MKDEGDMAIFLKSCNQKVEKKENKNDFESLDAFDESKFITRFEVWHH